MHSLRRLKTARKFHLLELPSRREDGNYQQKKTELESWNRLAVKLYNQISHFSIC